MIAREGRSIHFGDFHGQWNAAEDELALLVAGLWRHGYDFTAFQSPDRQEGLLFLPFHLIPPMQPVPGYRFGLYLVLFDNDGTGLETALQWPLHAERHLGQAWYIPYGGAWAGIELGPAPEA